jgi:hypothetical protein
VGRRRRTSRRSRSSRRTKRRCEERMLPSWAALLLHQSVVEEEERSCEVFEMALHISARVGPRHGITAWHVGVGGEEWQKIRLSLIYLHQTLFLRDDFPFGPFSPSFLSSHLLNCFNSFSHGFTTIYQRIMTTLTFLDLPGEIRNQIYRQLLIVPPLSVPRLLGDPPIYPQILAVCRKVHNEAKQILYGCNTFLAHPNLLFGLPRLSLYYDTISSPTLISLI